MLFVLSHSALLFASLDVFTPPQVSKIVLMNCLNSFRNVFVSLFLCSRIWDTASGQCLKTLIGKQALISLLIITNIFFLVGGVTCTVVKKSGYLLRFCDNLRADVKDLSINGCKL